MGKKLMGLVMMILFVGNIVVAKQGGENGDNTGQVRSISSMVRENDENKKQKKVERLRKSMEKSDGMNVIIKSEQDLEKLKVDNPEVKVKKLGNNLYRITMDKNSNLYKESFSGDYNIPENIDKYKVIAPIALNSMGYDLTGESMDKLWYMPKLGVDSYLTSLSGNQNRIKVGVIDSGISRSHVDLGSNVVEGYNFIDDSANANDDNGHGTYVASIIGGLVNGQGMFGINPNVELVPLKVLDGDGLGSTYDLIEAIDYAVNNNIKIINISLGGYGDPNESGICQMISYAKSRGVISIVSAGNANDDVGYYVPAGCDDAITVGSLDKNDSKASFSNYGAKVDVYEPGVEIYGAWNDGGYKSIDGTSASAAILAGEISQALASNSSMTEEQAMDYVRSNFKVSAPNNGSIPNTGGDTGTTLTGTNLTGVSSTGYVAPVVKQFDTGYYYSGLFMYEGKWYGNSFYSKDISFPKGILKKYKVDVMSEDEYRKSAKANVQLRAMSVPTNGLVAEYLLNGNANDTSGNGRHLSTYNIGWTPVSGSQGYVADFSQPGDSYMVAESAEFTGEFSISCWFNHSGGGEQYPCIKKQTGNGRKGYWSFQLSQSYTMGSESDIYFGFYDNVYDPNCAYRNYDRCYNYYIITAMGAYNNNQWHHAVGTYDGNELKLYIDGVLVNSRVVGAHTLYNDGNEVTVGRRLYEGNWGQYYQGKSAMMRLYTRGITQSEALQLYQEGLQRFGVVADDNTSSNVCSVSDGMNEQRGSNGGVGGDSVTQQNASNMKKGVDTQNEADPVSLSNGEFTYGNKLMHIPGNRMDYDMEVSYKSRVYYNGPVGINWDHNYNIYLTGDGDMMLYDGKLGVYKFVNESGVYQYNKGLRANLTTENGLFVVSFDDGKKYYFNANNKVSRIQDRYGNHMDMEYTNNLLSKVADTMGREINYVYYDHNRLQRVQDWNGRKVEFEYTAGYDLQKIKIDNGAGNTKTIQFEYTSGDDDSGHNISKLIDSNGKTYVENTYQGDRVATQKYGSGTLYYNYTVSNDKVVKTMVTNRNGVVTEYTYDDYGNQTKREVYARYGGSNYVYNYEYNSSGRLVKEKLPRGNGYKYSYDDKGNIIEKRFKSDVDAQDSSADIVTSNTFDTTWNTMLTQTNPDGTVIQNTLDTNGNVVQNKVVGLKDINNDTYDLTTTSVYNGSGFLMQQDLPDGSFRGYEYLSGQLTKISQGSGTNVLSGSFVYDQYGNVLKSIDFRGNEVNMTYTGFGDLQSKTTAEGVVDAFYYDLNSNKTWEGRILSGGVASTQYVYDDLDNPTNVIKAINASTNQNITKIYDYNGNLSEVRNGTGMWIGYQYNEFDGPTRQIFVMDDNDPSKNIIMDYSYDLNGNLIRIVDSKMNMTYYQYDLHDRISKKIMPNLSYYAYVYDKNGNVTAQILYSSGDVVLSKTEYVYDGLNRMIKQISYTDALNNTGAIINKIKYDLNGKIKESYDAKDNKTTNTYDIQGRLAQTQDPLNNKVMYTYDNNGNVVKKELVGSNNKIITTLYEYDRDNRLTTEKLQKAENEYITKSYQYNKLNQVTKITDGNGNVTDIEYDYLGHKTKEIKYVNGNSQNIEYTYDMDGNMTSIKDQKGNITRYEYDRKGRNTKVIYSDNKSVEYTYDKNDNVITKTDPNGTIVTNTYDNMDKLISKSIMLGTGVGGTTGENYEYDTAGRLINACDSLGKCIGYQYDSLGRVTKEINGGKEVNYTYDSNNNLTSLDIGGGSPITYTYDQINRINNITYGGENYGVYGYSGLEMSNLLLGNGNNIGYGYDSLGRLISIVNPNKTWSYTYDDEDNILGDGNKNYQYDDVYRLTQSQYVSGDINEQYGYDMAGNRTYSIADNTGMQYTSNELNQYIQLSGSNNTTIIYDDNGNIINNGKYILKYDYKNRLIGVYSGEQEIARYEYDVLGRRTEKIVNGEKTSYVYEGEDVLGEVKEVGGESMDKLYINGMGIDDVVGYVQEEMNLSEMEMGEYGFCEMRVMAWSGEFAGWGWTGLVDRCGYLEGKANEKVVNKYYYLKDQQGSVVGISNGSGTVVREYEYDGFGKGYVKVGTGKVSLENYTGYDYNNTRYFTSREYDSESELYYYRARYYDAEIGRFVSRDPIGQGDDVNVYNYVGANPLKYSDPMGLYSVGEFADDVGSVTTEVKNTAIVVGAIVACKTKEVVKDVDVVVSVVVKQVLDKGEDALYTMLLEGGKGSMAAGSVIMVGSIPVCQVGGVSIVISGGGTTLVAGASCGATIGAGGTLMAVGGAMATAGAAGKDWKNSRKSVQKDNVNTNQYKTLNKGEIDKLKEGKVDIHKLKNGDPKYDLVKDKKGDIYIQRKQKFGTIEPEPTDLNINDFYK